jgi:hypothetical protein
MGGSRREGRTDPCTMIHQRECRHQVAVGGCPVDRTERTDGLRTVLGEVAPSGFACCYITKGYITEEDPYQPSYGGRDFSLGPMENLFH